MSEHAPGPWFFDGVCQIVEAARPHMRICFLPSDHAEYASSKPNARLIAAAPDMLAALKEAVSFQNEDTECLVNSPQTGDAPDDVSNQDHCPDRRCYDHGCMVAKVNAWRAAIAKATEPERGP